MNSASSPSRPWARSSKRSVRRNRSRLAGRQSYATSTISVRRTPTAVATKPRRSATTSLSGTRAILLISSRTASVSIRRRALARILGTPPRRGIPGAGRGRGPVPGYAHAQATDRSPAPALDRWCAQHSGRGWRRRGRRAQRGPDQSTGTGRGGGSSPVPGHLRDHAS